MFILTTHINKEQNVLKILIHILIYFLLFFLFFSVFFIEAYVIDNNHSQKQIQTTLNTVIKSWNSQDFEKLTLYTNAQENTFQIETGFENYDEIHQLINNHIYDTKCQLIHSDYLSYGKNESKTIDAEVDMESYNNLSVISEVIQTLIHDNSKINKDYNQQDFIQSNIFTIQKNVQKIKREKKKRIPVHFIFDKEKGWTIPYSYNYDFYNELSGNALSMKSNVKTIEVK